MNKNKLLYLFLLLFATQRPTFATNWLNDMINVHEKTGHAVAVNASIESHSTFFSNHELVFFYASTCPYCHQLAPILKHYAKDHHATVIPLSLDNKPLVEFPHFWPATAEWVTPAFAGRPITYPALFIVHRKTLTLYSVAIGSMTASELEERMAILLPKIVAFEEKKPL